MERVPVNNCTGCGACLVRCPKAAIQMVEDKEGFLYPRVDLEKCDSCGLCRKICPVENNRSDQTQPPPLLYAGWTKDPALLQESTSGGIFSELARPVLNAGGVVFGAAYDDQMVVRHKSIETWEDLKYLRGSKYVQSDVGETYREAEEDLKTGRRVLYSGTPCQIAGLRKALSKNYSNLSTCDLICHGVPSPKVFRAALILYGKDEKAKVDDFIFRDKKFGWLYPTISIQFSNGKYILENNMDNPYNLGFLKNLYLRPACYLDSLKFSVV